MDPGPNLRRTKRAGLTVVVVVVVLAATSPPTSLAQPADDVTEQVERLIGQLKSDDPEVRRAAADQLWQLPQPEADPAPFVPAIAALIEAIEDEDASVRASVVQALGTVVWRTRSGSGSEPAIPLLIDALLHDADPNARGHAARTLGCIGRYVENEAVLKPAIQPLIHALGDEAKYDASAPSEARLEYKVSTEAAVALAMIAPRVQDEVALALAMPLLVQRLKHPDGATRWSGRWVLRQVAIAAQGEAAANAAMSALIEAFQEEENPKVRWSIGEELVELLVDLGDRHEAAANAAISALTEALQDDDEPRPWSIGEKRVKLLVDLGDLRFAQGDREGARRYYQEALQHWEGMPVRPDSREAWRREVDRYGMNYPYRSDYDPDLYLNTRLLEDTFLREKLDILDWQADRPTALKPDRIHRVAAVILRRLDVAWTDDQGKERHAVTTLDGEELDRLKSGWYWAARAVETYSRGKVEIRTEYFDFPDMVIKGTVRRGLDFGNLRREHHALFADMAEQSDTFLFFWDLGPRRASYWGSWFGVSGTDPPLKRGAVWRAAPEARINFHEFMHVVDYRACFNAPPCHGFDERMWHRPEGYNAKSEMDYHRWVFEHHFNPQGWGGFSFLERPAPLPPAEPVTITGPGVVVRLMGVEKDYGEAFATILVEARRELEEVLGVELPRTVELEVELDPDGHFIARADTVAWSHIIWSFPSKRALAPPTMGGAHNVQLVCGELARIAMHRRMVLQSGLPGGVDRGWERYAGCVVADEVARRLGDQLWPEPYDAATIEGLARLKGRVEGEAWADLPRDLRAAKVFCEIETRHGREVLARAMAQTLQAGTTGWELMARFVESLQKLTGDPDAGDWVPQELLTPPEAQSEGARHVDDDFFTGLKTTPDETGVLLQYDDGAPEAAKTLMGPTVLFRRPEGQYAVDRIAVLAAWDAETDPPDQDFLMFVCDQDLKPIARTAALFSLFERGEPQWYEIPIEPVQVPERFYVCLGFVWQEVAVCCDQSVPRSHSWWGLPDGLWRGGRLGECDWMIRAHLVEVGDHQ